MPQYPLNVPLGAKLSAAITTNAGTQVKTGSGVLMGVTVTGSPSAWTATFYDGTSTAGKELGTVSAGVGIAAFPPLKFATGLFVETAGTTPGSLQVAFF